MSKTPLHVASDECTVEGSRSPKAMPTGSVFHKQCAVQAQFNVDCWILDSHTPLQKDQAGGWIIRVGHCYTFNLTDVS